MKILYLKVISIISYDLIIEQNNEIYYEQVYSRTRV